jgi:flagellar protein FlaI
MKDVLYEVEGEIVKQLTGKFATVTNPARRKALITYAAKTIDPNISDDEIAEIEKDLDDFYPIKDVLGDQYIEDIMVNNTENIFVYDSRKGEEKLDVKIKNKEELDRFVNKLKLYATNQTAKGNILDVHLPTGSRANIVASPIGYDITIRNFRGKALSIIDLINAGEFDYQIAARLWLYVDGFSVRPANMMISGMPASGKTTLLNAMFSFFRPDARIVTIEETYELNTETQDNCVRLETSEEMPLEALVKNALRMRPDMIIIGEVRGAEANDMITAMNIGKIVMGTIHASSARDVINRLEHTPMNVPRDILPVIDSIIVISQVYENGVPQRKIVQMSEISGIETQILLSDLFKFDYKTHQSMPILPSVTYRDTISKLIGVVPQDILAEEQVRASVLMAMNKMGIRDLRSINEMVKEYYDSPETALNKLGLGHLHPIIRV